MRGIEYFRNISIGQYRAGNSKIHRLTPATKYLWLLALMIASIASSSYAGALLPLAVALSIGAATGIGPGFLLRGVRPLIPLLAFAAILQSLFTWPGDVSTALLSFGPLVFTAVQGAPRPHDVRAHPLPHDRDRPLHLRDERGRVGARHRGCIRPPRTPERRDRAPAHRLALAVGIALRFVPAIVGELEAIAKAQASRGADFGAGRGGPIAKARAYLPLFVPVTVRALERAEILAEAMEARGYTGEGRTRLACIPKREAKPSRAWRRSSPAPRSFALDYISRAH